MMSGLLVVAMLLWSADISSSLIVKSKETMSKNLVIVDLNHASLRTVSGRRSADGLNTRIRRHSRALNTLQRRLRRVNMCDTSKTCPKKHYIFIGFHAKESWYIKAGLGEIFTYSLN